MLDKESINMHKLFYYSFAYPQAVPLGNYMRNWNFAVWLQKISTCFSRTFWTQLWGMHSPKSLCSQTVVELSESRQMETEP